MSRDLPTPAHFATAAQWDAKAASLRALIDAAEARLERTMPDDLISAEVYAMQIARDAAGLACHCVRASDDETGVYREACIGDIAAIRDALAKIEAAVLKRPARREVA